MRVLKRNGQYENVSFDKITERLTKLCNKEPKLIYIDPVEIAQKVCGRISDTIKTSDLDEFAAQLCIEKNMVHFEYGVLASRIIISNNHKITLSSFSETMERLYTNVKKTKKTTDPAPRISKDVYDFIMENKDAIDNYIDYRKDYMFDYFGFKTLEKTYLQRINDIVVERIQHLFMRVSIGIHCGDLTKSLETYELLSSKYFTHATPTLYHSGTNHSQLLSCFLFGIGDSVEEMYRHAISDCAIISKWAGGIGLHISDIRSHGSRIKSTDGQSNGIMPMLRVLNDTARHINQSNKRNGSFAVYLEPHHKDLIAFLEAKLNHGDENARARDLFYALWISDLFMERVQNNDKWTLLDPNDCPGLTDVYGYDYKRLYEVYEASIEAEYAEKYGKNTSEYYEQIQHIQKPARQFWVKIVNSQMETGTPYICYKDAANRKSNQQNYGIIKSSNLCTEIIEYSDTKEYACCTLASISLPSFVERFDMSKIQSIDIYTKTNCQYCDYSKKYISSYGLTYKEHNLDDDNTRSVFFNELNKETVSCDEEGCHIVGQRFNTVPQIFINGVHIGGFSELYSYFKPTFNFNKLMEVTKVVTNNLNKIIDINYYPVDETKISNLRHRPLGIGVQGLADVYAIFKVSFDSKEAHLLNKQIFASIYYASVEKSVENAKEYREKLLNIKNNNRNCLDVNSIEYKILLEELGISDKYLGSYSTFEGSPMSMGKFQFDLWNEEPLYEVCGIKLDWDNLRYNVTNYGMRNSLLLAPMPTASTSQILGNNECIEPFTSNIYSRGTLAGQFTCVNKYLMDDLTRIGIWDTNLTDEIIYNKGTIRNINKIPQVIRNTYKVSWDLSMKSLIDQAAERGIYICQSQSLNLWVEEPTIDKVSSMHMYSWKRGLKTGIYYLRRRAVVQAQQFTIDPEKAQCLSCSA